jgi:hypothetical protein
MKIGGQAPDLVDLMHDCARPCDNPFASARYTIETFAFAAEKLESEFFLEQLELLADTRLRRIKAIGGSRNVQAIIDYR